jgi:alkylhydroperoxidase family enzyme
MLLESKAHYSDAQITELTFAIAHMNALNRIAVGARPLRPSSTRTQDPMNENAE